MREFEGVDGLGVVGDETAAMELHFDLILSACCSVLLNWSASISSYPVLSRKQKDN